MTIFTTAEEAAKHVKASTLSGDHFELAIADGFTFAGRPDVMGMGMAVVLDAILAHGFGPNGFERRGGYRLCRYKPLG
jgi:hypothetical protein